MENSKILVLLISCWYWCPVRSKPCFLAFWDTNAHARILFYSKNPLELGNSARFRVDFQRFCHLLVFSHKWDPKNRPKKIKFIMKNWFFKIALETFLGHLGGVGWPPACEKHVFALLLPYNVCIFCEDSVSLVWLQPNRQTVTHSD